jgi:hypothetical protein
VAATHDGAVQMIDTFVVRVHQHGACIAGQQRTAGPVARRSEVQDSCRGGLIASCATRPGRLMTIGCVRTYLAFTKLAAIRIWLRAYESAASLARHLNNRTPGPPPFFPMN